MKEIGDRLREFANRMGGITRLAELLNISQPRLSQFVNGSRDLNTRVLAKIAKLGCDINWLLTGESPEKRIGEMEDEIKYLVEGIHTLNNQLERISEPKEEYKKRKSIVDRWKLPKEAKAKQKK